MSVSEYNIRCITAANAGVMTGNGTNSYIVGRGEILIDPGPADTHHIDHLLTLVGDQLRWVLVTHTHRDHSPAAKSIAAEAGAELIGIPAPGGDNQDHSFVPDRIPQHDELLALSDCQIRAIHTPGHASNHVCYLDTETGLLFSGDHINQGTTVVIPPPDGSMRHYLQSLELLKSYPIHAIAPGHGSLIEAPMRAIDSLIRHRLQREMKTRRCLRELSATGPVSIDQLLPRVYDDVPAALHAIARHSLLAHLEKLEEDGLILLVNQDLPRQWVPA